MKSHFSRVVALGFLICVSFPLTAQMRKVPATVQMANSVDSKAPLKAFVSKMKQAKSFRGRLVATKTLFKDGEVVNSHKWELQSSWIGDGRGQGLCEKSLSDLIYTSNLSGRVSTRETIDVYDGVQRYHLNRPENTWELEPQDGKQKSPLLLLTNMWTVGPRGLKAALPVDFWESEIPNGQYTFDAKNGNLISWRSEDEGEDKGNGKKEITEISWSEIEFNKPLPNSLFVWHSPKGAIQVPRG